MVNKRWIHIFLLIMGVQTLSASWLSDMYGWFFPSPAYMPVLNIDDAQVADLATLPAEANDLDVRIMTALQQHRSELNALKTYLQELEKYIQHLQEDTVFYKIQKLFHTTLQTYRTHVHPHALSIQRAAVTTLQDTAQKAQEYKALTVLGLISTGCVSALCYFYTLHAELSDPESWSLWEYAQPIQPECPSDQKLALLLRTIQLRYGSWHDTGMLPFHKFYQALDRELFVLKRYQRYYAALYTLQLPWLNDFALYMAIPQRIRKIEELKTVWATWILAKRINSPYANHSAAENTSKHA